MIALTRKQWLDYLDKLCKEFNMTRGLFDDVPVTNPARDKAWEQFIRRKDVKALMKTKKDFPFPLDGSYDLWCIAWNTAWDKGFHEGWDEAMKARIGK